MSVQKVFEIIDELLGNEDFNILKSLTNDPFYEVDKQLSFLFLSPDKVREITENINALKDKLVNALLALSQEEAQEISRKVENTGSEYENILVMTTQSHTLLYRQKFAIAKVFWPEYDMANKILSSMVKHTNNLEPTGKDDRQLKEQVVFACKSLQELLDKHIIDEDFIVQVLDHWVYKEVDPELVNDLFANLIQRHSNFDILEKIAVTWKVFLPERASRRLRRIFAETTDPQVKENARHALMMIGENIMEPGDTYHITNAGIVNVKATLNNTTQTINNSSNIDLPTKKELEELIERLHNELDKVPQENAKDAEAVAKKAKMLVDAADEERPDKELLEITADRLMKAAQNLAKVVPVVLPIVKRIIALLIGF